MDRPHCCSVRREEGGGRRRRKIGRGRGGGEGGGEGGDARFSDFFLDRYRFLKILKWIKFRVSDQ